MGGPLEQNDKDLRAKARRLIGAGRLPRAKAVRTWGGLGSGLICTLCEQPILGTEPEFELQFDFAPAAAAIRFHRQCHSIWDAARHDPAMEHEQWTAVVEAMPPAGVPVEARWETGDARSVILSSMVARGAGTGEGLWIDLTSKAPLPHDWRAIEWRPSPVAPELVHQPLEPSLPKRAL